jgi:hypothetical protein
MFKSNGATVSKSLPVAMSSPMQQSLKMLREAGWTAEVVEHWHAFAKIRQDLCGCIDILAMKPGGGFVGCQVTNRGEIRAHIRKILAEPRALIFLKSGGRILLHGWRHRAEPGKKRKKWDCKGIEITERHFNKCQNSHTTPKQANEIKVFQRSKILQKSAF